MSRLASYDYRGLGRILRDRLTGDGRGWRVCAAEIRPPRGDGSTSVRRGWRVCAAEIGVCASDLSRICNGQPVSAPKVIAVCDWLQLSFRGFYEPPDPAVGADRERETPKMFHGKSTETEGACDAG